MSTKGFPLRQPVNFGTKQLSYITAHGTLGVVHKATVTAQAVLPPRSLCSINAAGRQGSRSPAPSRPCHRSLLGALLAGWSSPVPLPDAGTLQGSCPRVRAPSSFSLFSHVLGEGTATFLSIPAPHPTWVLGLQRPLSGPPGIPCFHLDSLHHSSQVFDFLPHRFFPTGLPSLSGLPLFR